MKNITLFFLLLVIAGISLQAQIIKDPKVSIIVSEPYSVIDAPIKKYFSVGGAVIAVKINRLTLMLQKFEVSSMNLVKEKTYKDLPKGFSYEGIVEMKDKIFVLYSLWDPEMETEQLYCRDIDADNLTASADRLLLKIKGRITGAASLGSIYGIAFGVVDKFSFFPSFNQQRLLVQYRMKPEIKDDSENYDEIGFLVLDFNLKEQWHQVVKMPYTEMKMNNEDYAVDDDGNVYLLATVFKDNTTKIKDKKTGLPNYNLEVLVKKEGIPTLERGVIEMEDKFINRLWLYGNHQNNMLCAGFYSDGKNLDDAKGIISMHLNSKAEVSEVITHEIPLEVLNMYEKGKTKKKNAKDKDKGKADFGELVLRKFLLSPEGDHILIGEQYYVSQHTTTTTSSTGVMSTRTTYRYHYNDMLISKVDALGNLKWMQKLPKQQLGGGGRGGMGFHYVRGTQAHYLVFLDNINNMELQLNERPKVHADGAGGFLTAYRVDDQTGEVNKVSLFDTRSLKVPFAKKGIPIYQFTMDRVIEVEPGVLAVEVYKKKKEDILIKISFTEE